TYRNLLRPRRTERGIPYRARAPGERSLHSTRRTGKPPTGGREAGGRGEGVTGQVRVMRSADPAKIPVHWRAGYMETCTSGSERGGWKSAAEVQDSCREAEVGRR